MASTVRKKTVSCETCGGAREEAERTKVQVASWE